MIQHKIALYNNLLALDFPTYMPQYEVAGIGYTVGGIELGEYEIVKEYHSFRKWVIWKNPEFKKSNIRACCALIYESESQMVVHAENFKTDYTSYGGTFTINLPIVGIEHIFRRLL